jgi:cytochrome c5
MEGEATMISKRLIFEMALLAVACALTMAAQQGTPPATIDSARHSDAKPQGRQGREDLQAQGQRVFQRRCSNCHNAPDGFSARISGTVVRHMRVRASLSKQEEEALLRFFNP